MQITITLPSNAVTLTTDYPVFVQDYVAEMYDVDTTITLGEQFAVEVTGDSTGLVKDDVGLWLVFASEPEWIDHLVGQLE